jgi:hypothetical protein
LDTVAEKKYVAGNEKGFGVLARKCGKGRVNLDDGAGTQNNDLHPDHELELGRLEYRKVGGLDAFEYADETRPSGLTRSS